MRNELFNDLLASVLETNEIIPSEKVIAAASQFLEAKAKLFREKTA